MVVPNQIQRRVVETAEHQFHATSPRRVYRAVRPGPIPNTVTVIGGPSNSVMADTTFFFSDLYRKLRNISPSYRHAASPRSPP